MVAEASAHRGSVLAAPAEHITGDKIQVFRQWRLPPKLGTSALPRSSSVPSPWETGPCPASGCGFKAVCQPRAILWGVSPPPHASSLTSGRLQRCTVKPAFLATWLQPSSCSPLFREAKVHLEMTGRSCNLPGRRQDCEFKACLGNLANSRMA